jgi:hypothetical protein
VGTYCWTHPSGMGLLSGLVIILESPLTALGGKPVLKRGGKRSFAGLYSFYTADIGVQVRCGMRWYLCTARKDKGEKHQPTTPQHTLTGRRRRGWVCVI